MEEHEAVEVRVIRVEILRIVHCVEVVDIGCNFHLWAESIFDYAAKWIGRCTFWQRKFGVAVRHTLGPNEDEIDECVGEYVSELEPDFTW